VSLDFCLGMFRDHDFVVSLARVPAVLIDTSLRLLERFVAAEPAARMAPNNVVRPRVVRRLSFHNVQWARLPFKEQEISQIAEETQEDSSGQAPDPVSAEGSGPESPTRSSLPGGGSDPVEHVQLKPLNSWHSSCR
jgi:hypothetical protein